MSINTEMTALADAVRAKTGLTDTLSIAEMTTAIGNIEIGVDIDLTGVTVTADKMLEGIVAVDGTGSKVTGNIKTVEASKTDNVITVPVGYIAEEQTFEVGEGGGDTDLSFVTATAGDILVGKVGADINGNPVHGTIANATLQVSENVVTMPVGYSSGETVTIPEMTIEVTADKITVPVGYNKTEQEFEMSVGGDGDEFYKCVSVSKDMDIVKLVVSGAGTEEANGEYELTDITSDSISEVWQKKGGGCFVYRRYDFWLISSDLGYNQDEALYAHQESYPEADIWVCRSGVDPEPTVERVTEHISGDYTWSGRKAIFDNGIYYFEDKVTDGLRFSVLVPEVNQIYTPDALAHVKWLYLGNEPSLVFYAPLTSLAESAATGQTLVYTGTPEVAEINGVPCLHFSRGQGISTLDNIGISGSAPRTVCFYALPDDNLPDYPTAVFWGNQNGDYGSRFLFGPKRNGENLRLMFGGWYNDTEFNSSVKIANKLIHCAIVYDGEKTKLYVDGKSGGNPISNLNTTDSKLYIAYSDIVPDYSFGGYIADFRVYNRALSDAEIKTLAGKDLPKPVFSVMLDSEKNTADTGQPITAHGEITYGYEGFVGCANFASGSYITCTDLSELPSGNSNRTLSCWVKVVSGTGRYGILSYGSDVSDQLFALEVRDGYLTVYGGSSSSEASSIDKIDLTYWNHLALVYENGTVYFYLNGKLSATTFNYQYNTVPTTLWIGSINGEIGSDLPKRIAAVDIFDKALDADQIEELAQYLYVERPDSATVDLDGTFNAVLAGSSISVQDGADDGLKWSAGLTQIEGLYFNGDVKLDLTGITTDLLQDDFRLDIGVSLIDTGRRHAILATANQDCILGIDTNGGHYNLWVGNGSYWIIQADWDDGSSYGGSSIGIKNAVPTLLSIVYRKGQYISLFVNGELAVFKENLPSDFSFPTGYTLRLGKWGNGEYGAVGTFEKLSISPYAVKPSQTDAELMKYFAADFGKSSYYSVFNARTVLFADSNGQPCLKEYDGHALCGTFTYLAYDIMRGGCILVAKDPYSCLSRFTSIGISTAVSFDYNGETWYYAASTVYMPLGKMIDFPMLDNNEMLKCATELLQRYFGVYTANDLDCNVIVRNAGTDIINGEYFLPVDTSVGHVPSQTLYTQKDRNIAICNRTFADSVIPSGRCLVSYHVAENYVDPDREMQYYIEIENKRKTVRYWSTLMWGEYPPPTVAPGLRKSSVYYDPKDFEHLAAEKGLYEINTDSEALSDLKGVYIYRNTHPGYFDKSISTIIDYDGSGDNGKFIIIPIIGGERLMYYMFVARNVEDQDRYGGKVLIGQIYREQFDSKGNFVHYVTINGVAGSLTVKNYQRSNEIRLIDSPDGHQMADGVYQLIKYPERYSGKSVYDTTKQMWGNGTYFIAYRNGSWYVTTTLQYTYEGCIAGSLPADGSTKPISVDWTNGIKTEVYSHE